MTKNKESVALTKIYKSFGNILITYPSTFELMIYQLTFFILLFAIYNSYGQEHRVSLKGQIIEFERPISGAHIYNLKTAQGTSSSDQGNFTINVRLNDTLIISHVKYFSLKLAIDESTLNHTNLIIHMYEKTNQLDTVNIPNHDLTQNLRFDSQNRPRVANKDSLVAEFQWLASMASSKDFEISKFDSEAPPKVIVDPTGGPSVRSSASIGFKFKDLILKQEIRIKRNFPKQIIADFGITYFTETLKIPNDKVYHFITYCEQRNIMELYKKNELMKILTILGEESKEYLKIKELNSMD